MKHAFIVNTEDVNEYGYRVLTDGIDYAQYMRNPVVLFMHERGNKGNEVIGRCTKLYKEDGKLIAEIEFDTEDGFAKQIADKVERGFIRMASIYADIKASSAEPENIVQGQLYETVTACKLVEISIVDIGGNDNALRLSKNGKPFQLKKLVFKNQYNMEIKTIALALGMSESTKDADVLIEVQSLKLAKENAERRVAELEGKQRETQTAEAAQLVEKAVALGLIPEGLKAGQIRQFESDFDGQKAVLSQLIAGKEQDQKNQGKNETVRRVVLGKGDKPTGEETFDFLQKNNPERLRLIRDTEPEEYARLAKEYANGKRSK
ncbi:MAG: HK97 family phage prohead protease [Capnocytophaga sp.]|nr:HK97 family phage prohead protease [Capnocytophaga sp.]